ncbi:MAG: hypothetical protein IH963_13065 [Chloroflexi bacterium]|nr:hypothetical protein [Chloroflexota bacterium]MCH8893343.1 hypothetical protein [Chloroflexota bacterium]MCI0788307.1 hypothetical protein [Chloroflexota bacterium]MCI0801915.1 hypothetical protein [Chloroflexota bacterium]MCI0811133.1 hypothetical protein [Chloroflexota bacterium]
MFETVKNEDFMILSVAMDADVEAARPWIEAASPDYITLIDQNHLLSSLYNMVNVPQAVWIDETGRIVRPVETGGSLDIAKEYDQETRAQAKSTYIDAVKDWAVNGSASAFLFDIDEAMKRVPAMTNEAAMAHAKFQLGQYLKRNGRTDEADVIFSECCQLHPDSWNIYRETAERNERGLAAGDEFWEKVRSLGEKPYYSTIDMEGMPG